MRTKAELCICNTCWHTIHPSSYPNQWKAVKSLIISFLLLPLPSVSHGPSPGTAGRGRGSSARCCSAGNPEECSSEDTGGPAAGKTEPRGHCLKTKDRKRALNDNGKLMKPLGERCSCLRSYLLHFSTFSHAVHLETSRSALIQPFKT